MRLILVIAVCVSCSGVYHRLLLLVSPCSCGRVMMVSIANPILVCCCRQSAADDDDHCHSFHSSDDRSRLVSTHLFVCSSVGLVCAAATVVHLSGSNSLALQFA